MQEPTPRPTAASLLATKLFVPPLREDRIPRPRLVERLAAGLARRLTLISAPAGFGKSSILAEWVHQAPATGGATAPAIAWLSLDTADNDPIRFWTYAVAALQNGPKIGKTGHADLPAWAGALHEVLGWLRLDPPPQLTFILDGLINGIAASGRPLVLVLDDYHAIGSAQVHESVAYLLEHQPPNLHLVMATRVDPPLPLPRLRARGQLVEIRAEDLRFTHDETAAFMNQAMALGLEGGDVAALAARTEGWIVGLQMAALALQGLAVQGAALAPGRRQERFAQFIQAFTGSHRYVLEYLVEEVLNRQPAAVRTFLLQAAILDRFCGPLCDAVVGGSGSSQGMLELLERANLFLVPLDGEQRWYRFHHLFAELLHHRLRQEMPAQGICELHSRASHWHERNGSLDGAVHHALQAQDFERAASLAEPVAQATFFSGQMATLSRWMEALPEQLLRVRPRLRLYQSWVHSIGGKMDRADHSLQESQQALQALPPSPENDALRRELTMLMARNAAMGAALSSDTAEAGLRSLEELARMTADDAVSRSRVMLGLGMAYLFNGHDGQAGPAFAQAFELAHATGNLNLAANSLFIWATGELYYGRLQQAAQLCQRVVDLVHSDRGEQPLPAPGPWAVTSAAPLPSGAGYIGLADIARERNDLEAAARCLDQGLALCQQGGLAIDLCPGYLTQSRLKQAQGDVPGAFAALQRAAQVFRLEQAWPVLLQYVAQQVRLHLLLGDVEEAARWALKPGSALGGGRGEARLPIVLHEVYQVILARVHLAQGDAEQALALLDQILPQAEAAGRLIPELYLVKALAWRQMAGPAQAAQGPGPRARQAWQEALGALRRSLEAARPEGYLRLYLDEGPAAQALLATLGQEAALTPQLAQYVQDLLRAFARDGASALEGPGPVAAALALPSPGQASARPQPLAEPLSPRELEVLNLIHAGYSNQAIADQLVISLHTVKKHTSNILGKLDATSRVQAVARARQLGLI